MSKEAEKETYRTGTVGFKWYGTDPVTGKQRLIPDGELGEKLIAGPPGILEKINAALNVPATGEAVIKGVIGTGLAGVALEAALKGSSIPALILVAVSGACLKSAWNSQVKGAKEQSYLNTILPPDY